MTDPHAQHDDSEESEESLPAHVRPIAMICKWFGVLLAALSAGFFLYWTFTQGWGVAAGFAAFAVIYGLSIWHANALTLECFDE